MASPILTTKLFIPPLRSDLLPRKRLIEKLDLCVNFPLTLVSASAGSGKTTALSEWVNQNDRQTAWLSLDPDDNDPAQFLTYIIYAFRNIKADFGQEPLENLGSGQPDAEDTNLIKILNELSEFPSQTFLIFDDYHTISEPKVHEMLSFLIDHLPPKIHLLFATRVDPPWTLARYRARNQLYELRGQDLRFSTEEIMEFLNRTVGAELPIEEITALEERTEGWVAGLQLAALSMQGHQDVSKFVKDFTGSHLFVAEYLIEEILHQQPDETKNFLLKTSILDRLHAGLCQAVSGSADSMEIIKRLHHANVFIVPLDEHGQWFRYHHLFADLLRSRLRQQFTQDQIAQLHFQACEWYESQHLPVEAVHHAFSADHFNKAASLVDVYGQEMFFAERYNILKNWLDSIPEKFFAQYPRLDVFRLLVNLLEGTLDMFEQTLIEKEKMIKALPPSPENDLLRRRALVNLSLFYAFQNTEKAIRIAEETLAEIPDEDLHMRAYLYGSFYRAYGMEGNIEKSAAAYRESFRLAEITGQYEMIANTTKIRTFDLCQYGLLDEAADYCQRIIDVGLRQQPRIFYPAGPCYVGLGGIYLERNDLAKAEELIYRGLELCESGANYGLFTSYVQKIRLLQAKGQLEEAIEVLQYFERTFQRREFTFWAQKVSLLLAAGDLSGAEALIPQLRQILGASYYAQELPLIAAESFKLSLARILIALGEIEEVLTLLDEIQVSVVPDRRFGRLMEVYILRALALQKMQPGQPSLQAITSMASAIELAIEPRFVMLFLEEGPSLVPLLQAVIGQSSTSAQVKQYAQKLVSAFASAGGAPSPTTGSAAGVLIEQLTPREMEVLALIAVGDSNQQIADRLVVTLRTVKKHTSNIYGKLNVSSRTQAIAYAREIGLLSKD